MTFNPVNMVKVMAQIANNAMVMIKQSVQEKGLNPAGSKYPAYSKGYQKRKQKEGKYRGFVDFTLTGQDVW